MPLGHDNANDGYDQDFTRLTVFMKSGVDDRSLAIVCASYAEKYLGSLIQYRMPGLTPNLRTRLFSPNGILGPFSARVAIGKALKTIDDDMHHDLSLLG